MILIGQLLTKAFPSHDRKSREVLGFSGYEVAYALRKEFKGWSPGVLRE